MSKKYKHIKLPAQFIKSESSHEPRGGRVIPDFSGIDFNKQKERLLQGFESIDYFFSEKNNTIVLDKDRTSNELEIIFHGQYFKKFVDRYRIKVYHKDEDSNEDSIIYGKISNKKFDENTPSDFERLKNDFSIYKDNDGLKSYFQKIKEVKPLTLDQIIEKSLKEDFEREPNNEIVVDISLAGDGLAGDRIEVLKQEYGERFLSKVNSNLLRFCRVRTKFSDIKNMAKKISGIVDIEHGPLYVFQPSALGEGVEGVEMVLAKDGLRPIFIFDGSVNDQHFIIKGAIIENKKTIDVHMDHGTAVASLMICGALIEPNSIVEQKNKVIAVNYFEDLDKAEELLEMHVQDFAQKHSILIINFSINNYYLCYRRNKVDKLSILLDDLAKRFNCLFVISVGNLFKNWNPTMTTACQQVGYPNYFKLDCTRILPPADSINNISVGSITYQESINSLAKIKNPSPITRANLDGNAFIKPDLVHFDSNVSNGPYGYKGEGNGVYMAAEESSTLTRRAGTSFATPLVTHNAGIIHNYYPDYKINTIKGLLLHFAEAVEANGVTDKELKEKLVGFGMTNIDAAIHSLNSRSCLIIEDEIGINKQKIIKFPIPSCISGSRSKRLRIRKTLVYNPIVNPIDLKNYNPLNITVQLVRMDGQDIGSSMSRSIYDGAHKKSNVKRYIPQDVSTLKHVGGFWQLRVTSEARGDSLPTGYIQPYSIILSIEDLFSDNTIDLHSEIESMIEIETNIEIPIQI